MSQTDIVKDVMNNISAKPAKQNMSDYTPR